MMKNNQFIGEDYDKLPYDKKCDFDDGFVDKDPVKPCGHILGFISHRHEGEEFASIIYLDDDKDDIAEIHKNDKFIFCPKCGKRLKEE